jgi:hypothetical protein
MIRSWETHDEATTALTPRMDGARRRSPVAMLDVRQAGSIVEFQKNLAKF